MVVDHWRRSGFDRRCPVRLGRVHRVRSGGWRQMKVEKINLRALLFALMWLAGAALLAWVMVG